MTRLLAVLERYDSAGRRLLLAALIGFVALVLLTAFVLITGRLTTLEMFMIMTMLVIAPLEGALSTPPLSQPERSSFMDAASVLYMPAAALGTASLFLPAGGIAALMAVPWALCMYLIGAHGVARFLRRGFALPEELAVDLGILYLPLGASWFIASRFGVRPLGVPELVVLLAAVHFANAGGSALFLTGMAGRWIARRGLTRAQSALFLPMFGGFAGPMLTAFGIAYTWQTVEKSGAVSMELGYLALVILLLFVVAPGLESRAARILLRISGGALMVGLCFAVLYTTRVLDIPKMIHSHGYIMGPLFCTVGLTTWVLLGPVAGRVQDAKPDWATIVAGVAASLFLPFIGQMLLSYQLVDFWKSQAPAAFTAWFSTNLPKMTTVLGGLGGAAGLYVVLAAWLGKDTYRRRGWLGLAALCWVLIFTANPLFFESANARLATPLPPADLAALLEEWGRWHELRLGLGLVGTAAAVRALAVGRPIRAGVFAQIGALLAGLFAGALIMASVLHTIWQTQSPADFHAWFSANAARLEQVTDLLMWLTGILTVLAFLTAAGPRLWLGLAAGSWALIAAARVLYFGSADAQLAAGPLAPEALTAALGSWGLWQNARLSLGLAAMGFSLLGLAGGRVTNAFKFGDAPATDVPPGGEPAPASDPVPVPPPFRTMDDVRDGLAKLDDELLKRRDRRGVFAMTYRTMVEELRRWIDRRSFREQEWLCRYAIALANQYRNALEAYERRDLAAVPACWRIAFDVAARRDETVTQDTLLSLNAHINYDHVRALVEAGLDPNRGQRHLDYLKVNEVLDACTEAVQQRVGQAYAPGLRALEQAAGPLDQLMSSFSMERARDSAWTWAGRITDAPTPAARAELLRELAGKAEEVGQLLASPPEEGAWLWRVLNKLENAAAVDLPPGSLGLPWLGQTLDFARDPVGLLYKRFREHGPVFKLRLLGQDLIAFVGPEAFSRLSGPQAERYLRREGANPPAWRELMGGTSSPHVDGAVRLRRKRLLLQAFTPEALAEYVPLLETVARAYLDRWEKLGRFSWLAELKTYSIAACDMLYLGAAPEVRSPEATADGDALYAGFSAPPIPLPFTAFGRARKARDQMMARIGQAAAAASADDKHVIGQLVRARDEVGGLTVEEIQREVLQFYFASYGANYAALSCVVIALAQNPAVLARVRQEVRRHAPSGAFTPEALGAMTYLDQVTREVRRLYPLTASTLFATVREPFVLYGRLVPAGWKVIGCVHASMHDPRTFQDPETFNPDRFGPGRTEGAVPNAYVAHGGGPRDGHRCTGEALADVHLKLFTAALARDYAWELPPQDLSLDPRGIPSPRGGLQVAFSRAAKDASTAAAS